MCILCVFRYLVIIITKYYYLCISGISSTRAKTQSAVRKLTQRHYLKKNYLKKVYLKSSLLLWKNKMYISCRTYTWYIYILKSRNIKWIMHSWKQNEYRSLYWYICDRNMCKSGLQSCNILCNWSCKEHKWLNWICRQTYTLEFKNTKHQDINLASINIHKICIKVITP